MMENKILVLCSGNKDLTIAASATLKEAYAKENVVIVGVDEIKQYPEDITRCRKLEAQPILFRARPEIEIPYFHEMPRCRNHSTKGGYSEKAVLKRRKKNKNKKTHR